MTVAPNPAEEEETDSMEFVDLYEELESLKRRVMVQILHIWQVRVEAGGGVYHPKERLEEARDILVGELTEPKIL